LAIMAADIFGSPNIGVYCLCSDALAIVPAETPEKWIRRFQECLGVDVCATNIGGSRLIGALVTGNSTGIVLPYLARGYEVERIKSMVDLNIAIVEDRKTALGNTILVNDNGAVVDPRFSEKVVRKLSNTFGVEVVKAEIAGMPYVGSFAVATNKGALTHPSVKLEEKEVVEEVLKVRMDSGTVNSGVPYVKAGLIANSQGAVVGFSTTGPELMAITNTLDLQ